MYSIALKLWTTPTTRQLAGAKDCAMSTCKNCYAFFGTAPDKLHFLFFMFFLNNNFAEKLHGLAWD